MGTRRESIPLFVATMTLSSGNSSASCRVVGWVMAIVQYCLLHPVESFTPFPLLMHNVGRGMMSTHGIFFQDNGGPSSTSRSSSDRWSDPETLYPTMEIDSTMDEPITVTPKVRRMYETFQWQHMDQDGKEHVYNINYRVDGPVDGPPVLLVHGFGANVGHFRHQFPALTETGYRVYAIDMLGFGASDKPAHVEYSIELFTELLSDFTAAMDNQLASSNSTSLLPAKKWVVAGNSIGGLCSLAVAEKLPNLVRGVVLFNCAGGMTAFRYEDLPAMVRPILFFFRKVMLGPRFGGYFFTNFKTRENIESILKFQGVYRNASNVDEELMETLLEPGNDEGAQTVFLKVFGGPPGPTPESILPNLDCPVLAIWGGDDPWTPVDRGMHPATEFHNYVKNKEDFKLVVLPGVGHCPHDEAPDAVNGHLIPWIQALALSSHDGDT